MRCTAVILAPGKLPPEEFRCEPSLAAMSRPYFKEQDQKKKLTSETKMKPTKDDEQSIRPAVRLQLRAEEKRNITGC